MPTHPTVQPWSLAVVAVVAAVSAACPGDVLNDTGSVSGVACAPLTGRPVANQPIDLSSVDVGVSQVAVRTATSNAAGFFSVGGVEPGVYRVGVRGASRSFAVVEVGFREAAVVNDPGCADRPGVFGIGTLEGRFCDHSVGAPHTDATVTVMSSDGSTVDAATDPVTGEFSVDVPSGAYTVELRSPTSRRAVFAEVSEGERTRVGDDVCDTAAATTFAVGRVCRSGDDERPAVDAVVRARWTSAGGDEQRSDRVLTMADGSFRIDQLTPAPGSALRLEATLAGERAVWTAEASVGADGGIEVHPGLPCQVLGEDDGSQPLVPLLVLGRNDRVSPSVAGPTDLIDTRESGPWAEQTFGELDGLLGYERIVVTCGIDEREFDPRLSTTSTQNLRRFVAEGGTLVVTDLAYELVEQSFSERVNFLGNDTLVGDAERGRGGLVLAARDRVGAAIDVDLSDGNTFAVVSEVAADVDVLISGDVVFVDDGAAETLSDAPLAIRFRHGFGTVIYTSFHLDGGVSDEVLADVLTDH